MLEVRTPTTCPGKRAAGNRFSSFFYRQSFRVTFDLCLDIHETSAPRQGPYVSSSSNSSSSSSSSSSTSPSGGNGSGGSSSSSSSSSCSSSNSSSSSLRKFLDNFR